MSLFLTFDLTRNYRITPNLTIGSGRAMIHWKKNVTIRVALRLKSCGSGFTTIRSKGLTGRVGSAGSGHDPLKEGLAGLVGSAAPTRPGSDLLPLDGLSVQRPVRYSPIGNKFVYFSAYSMFVHVCGTFRCSPCAQKLSMHVGLRACYREGIQTNQTYPHSFSIATFQPLGETCASTLLSLTRSQSLLSQRR